MKRLKRIAYRTLEILDYRTFVVATGFLVVAIFGYVLVVALQSARDSADAAKTATDAANKRASGATRRIDLLNAQIEQAQAEIAAGRDERGQQAAALAALNEQVRRLGGTPIVMVTVRPYPSPSSSPAPRATSSPAPKPSATARPTPSPTCTRLPVVGICQPRKA